MTFWPRCPNWAILTAASSRLAGVAPYVRQSGQWHGKRYIGGGRPLARKALYMAALVASRHHSSLKLFYQRLIQRQKPAKVVLVALMRKLIILLNAHLKHLQTPLQTKTIATTGLKRAVPTKARIGLHGAPSVCKFSRSTRWVGSSVGRAVPF